MKILHIIDTLSLGGAQTVVRGIFEYNEINDKLHLFALRESNIKMNIDHHNVITYVGDRRYSFKPLKELKVLIEKESINVIHCHLFRSYFFGSLLKTLYYPNVRLVYHEHGKIFNNSIFYKLFIKYSKPHTNLYIAVSKAAKRHLINYAGVPEDKIRTLYNFVDLDKYDIGKVKWDVMEERGNLGISKRDFVVGFAGRLIERKGWRTFIDAAELILEKQPNVTFLIAGDGADKKIILESINIKKLDKKVIFLGYTTEMVWFYSLLDCFVIPSYWEPMGLTEIEAQAMGIPVISSDVEALNEIIRHNENGLLFTVKDKKDLAEKILKLIFNADLRQQLISGGYETVKDFSLKDYSIKVRGIYNELF